MSARFGGWNLKCLFVSRDVTTPSRHVTTLYFHLPAPSLLTHFIITLTVRTTKKSSKFEFSVPPLKLNTRDHLYLSVVIANLQLLNRPDFLKSLKCDKMHNSLTYLFTLTSLHFKILTFTRNYITCCFLYGFGSEIGG